MNHKIAISSLLLLSACMVDGGTTVTFHEGIDPNAIIKKPTENENNNKQNEQTPEVKPEPKEVSASTVLKNHPWVGRKYNNETGNSEVSDIAVLFGSNFDNDYYRLETDENSNETIFTTNGWSDEGYANSDIWYFKSKNIEKGENDWTKISFDYIPEICRNCLASVSSGLEPINEYDLTLGGNKTGLSYSDYGLWRHTRTIPYDGDYDGDVPPDPEVYKWYDFVLMVPHYMTNNGAPRFGVVFNDVDKDLTFKGDTLAVLHDNYTSNSSADRELTGKMEITFNPGYDIVDNMGSNGYSSGIKNIKIAYDDFRTLQSNEFNNPTYLYDETGAGWNMYDLEAYFAGPNRISVNEVVGKYCVQGDEYPTRCAGNECDSGPISNTNLSIIGAFGAKSDEILDVDRFILRPPLEK